MNLLLLALVRKDMGQQREPDLWYPWVTSCLDFDSSHTSPNRMIKNVKNDSSAPLHPIFSLANRRFQSGASGVSPRSAAADKQKI